MLLQIAIALLQITTICYYKLRQLLVLLQITAGITNYDVITNYVEAVSMWIIRAKKLPLLFS